MDIETDNSKTLLIALARISEIEAENARLRAEIDAANAQMPLTTIQVLQGYPSVVSRSQCGVKDGTYKVYARPLPAQQSPAIEITKEMIYSFCHAISDASITEQEFNEVKIGLTASLSHLQQSPAAAVPASVDIGFIEDCLIAYKSGLYFDGAEGLRNKIDQQLSAIKQPSPRITEQDAREFAASVIRYCNTRKNVAWGTDSYMRETGRDLLAKLNEAKHD